MQHRFSRSLFRETNLLQTNPRPNRIIDGERRWGILTMRPSLAKLIKYKPIPNPQPNDQPNHYDIDLFTHLLAQQQQQQAPSCVLAHEASSCFEL